MSPDNNTHHRAAVIAHSHVYYGNGTVVETRAGVDELLVPLLNGTVGRFTQHAAVVLNDVSLWQVARQSAHATEAGWSHSAITPWTLFHRADGRTVSVGVRSAFTGNQVHALFAPHHDAGVVAMLMDRYHRLTGTSWRGTYFTTAMAGIRLTWENTRGPDPLWHVPRVASSSVGPMEWVRPLTTDEAVWGYVHTFDSNMAYLSAAINLEGAWSGLDQTGPQMFDQRLPGYWLVRLEQATRDLDARPGRPPLFDPRKIMKDGCVWVTTPYAKLLQDLGDRVDVLDAWTGRATPTHVPHARVLRAWAEKLRDARTALNAGPPGGLTPHLVEAVKRTYKDATGGLQRETSRVYRPDWADALVDLSRANLYRRILRIHSSQGVWPVKVKVDSLSYADIVPHPEPAADARFTNLYDELPVRAGLGGFKRETTVTTKAWKAAHRPGGRLQRVRSAR